MKLREIRQMRWEELRYANQKHALSPEERAEFEALDKGVQRKVMFLIPALAVGVTAWLIGIDFGPSLLLGLIAGTMPWLALVFQWR